MVKVQLRVVGTEQDLKFAWIDVDQQMHVDDFVKKVEFVTQIPVEFQYIELRGERLSVTEYPLQNIVFGEDIVVKHSLFGNWTAYILMINQIRKMTTSGVTSGRREISLKARVQLSPLFSSNFFAVYPSLAVEELNISNSLNFLIYNTRKYLERSVFAYFINKYPNKTVELMQKPNSMGGIHLGVFVLVDGVPSYYVKTIGSAPESDEEMECAHRIDLTELFVYYLMKLIGVGPEEVHVIPDTNNSKLIFIGTKLINGFRTASGVSAVEMIANPSVEQRKNVVLDDDMKREMRVLSSLLCLGDVQRNKGNHGVVEIPADATNGICASRELRIIDFGINMGSVCSKPRIFNSEADVPFLEIYFKKWNLSENIYKAKEELMTNPSLKDNDNLNTNVFDMYFKRLIDAIEGVKSEN